MMTCASMPVAVIAETRAFIWVFTWPASKAIESELSTTTMRSAGRLSRLASEMSSPHS